MMIPLLFISSASFFIPVEMTNKVVLKTEKFQEAIELSKENDVDIVIALSASKNISDVATQFSSISTIYNSSCKFILIPYKDIRRNLNSIKEYKNKCPPKPCILTISKGQIVDFTHIKNPGFLAGAVENILNPDMDIAEDQNELVRSIGYTPYTIICNQHQYNKAQVVVKEMTHVVGPISIKLVTEEVQKSTGMNTDQFALYREEDQEMLIFDGTIRDFKRNSVPAYHRFTRREILKSEKILITWIRHQVSSEHIRLFSDLGSALNAENVHDFEFGAIDNEDIPEFGAFVGASDFSIDNFSVFNFKHGCTYNTTSFFNQFPDHKLNYTTWLQPLADFVMAIKSDVIKPTYINEEVENKPGDALVKLNHETYHNFTRDPDNDVVVMFVRPFCATCRRFLRRFKEFAEFYPKAPIGPVKFGFIDISRNGNVGHYPPRVTDPHLVLFRRNETDPQGLPLLGAFDEASIRRAISVFGSSGDRSYQGRPFGDIARVNASVKAALERIPLGQQRSVKRAHDIFLRSLLPTADGEWRADPLTAEVNLSALNEAEREALLAAVKAQEELEKNTTVNSTVNSTENLTSKSTTENATENTAKSAKKEVTGEAADL